MIEIAGRKRIEEALQKSERNFRSLAEELRTQNEELTRFNSAAVGRELRMLELKKEINDLCRTAGQPPRYSLDFAESEPVAAGILPAVDSGTPACRINRLPAGAASAAVIRPTPEVPL